MDIFTGKCLFFLHEWRFQCKKFKCLHVETRSIVRYLFFCYCDIITCAHDRCEHPTLSVLDRAETRLGPLPQDFTAPSPQGGMKSLFVVTGPVPLQHSPVVLAVYLNIKDKREVPKNINHSVARSINPNNYSLPACSIYCTEHCRSVYLYNVCRTQWPSSSLSLFFNKQLSHCCCRAKSTMQ